MKTKVLYVEDEPFLGRIVKETLESRSFEVVMFDNGTAAAQAFPSVKPDICVLDIMLPQKDGFALAKNIRETNPSIPIIFVTAKTQTEDLVRGFQSGGNDYIRKPFSMEELIARINNLLNLTGAPKTNVENVRIGKYEFNPIRYELTMMGEIKKLSHREASLLSLLTKNINGITNRKDILMTIWGDDSFFNSRNLDVYINKLREYLREDPSIEIRTIKGVGYHFGMG